MHKCNIIISTGRLGLQLEQETEAGDGNKRQMEVQQYLKGFSATTPHGQKLQRGDPAVHPRIPEPG